MQEHGIGNKERWDELKQKLENEENLLGVDKEYLIAKLMEFEQGVVTTTLDVEGRDIVAYLRIVSGQAVIGLMFLKDMVMGLTDAFGSRSGLWRETFVQQKKM